MAKRDYYDILGVPKDASKDNIKKAYRKLAKQYHPDRNKESGAEEQFKEISEAYGVLSDGTKRSQYDQYGHAGIDSRYSAEDIFRTINFEDIFKDINFSFGGFDSVFDIFFGGRKRRRAGPKRGADLRYDLEITLNEVYSGSKKRIRIPRRGTCPACNGSRSKPGSKPKECISCQGTGELRITKRTPFGHFTSITTCGKCRGEGRVIADPCPECRGKGVVRRTKELEVRIPPGVESGSRLRMSGEGEAGEKGAPPGDLYVLLHVKLHEVFERHGDDIVCELPISFHQAALGDELEVPTLNGRAKMRIPPGTQTGTIFRLKGKGLPNLNSSPKGDQHVHVIVETPTDLTKAQKEILKEFAKLEDTKKGFLGRMTEGIKDVLS
ncbi:MAG: molecular chaperone DnaJ [Candidatus Hydrothermarchaeales archaeon]